MENTTDIAQVILDTINTLLGNLFSSIDNNLYSILDKISKELNLDTYKVNVDEVEDVARQYGIMSIPTVMIFEKGKMTKKNVGFMDETELREFVK